ncbi:MAG: T9SS type A sorting domain-containing protein, partial [Ferruginibacter sp.]
NPATAFINLSVSSAIAGAKPTGYVYNGLGSLVKTFSITGTYQKINIELLPPGLYSVRFAYNKNSFTFLFIKK